MGCKAFMITPTYLIRMNDSRRSPGWKQLGDFLFAKRAPGGALMNQNRSLWVPVRVRYKISSVPSIS